MLLPATASHSSTSKSILTLLLATALITATVWPRSAEAEEEATPTAFGGVIVVTLLAVVAIGGIVTAVLTGVDIGNEERPSRARRIWTWVFGVANLSIGVAAIALADSEDTLSYGLGAGFAAIGVTDIVLAVVGAGIPEDGENVSWGPAALLDAEGNPSPGLVFTIRGW